MNETSTRPRVEEKAKTTAATPVDGARADGRRFNHAIVPVVIFAGLALLFLFALQRGGPSTLPSALIGKPVPTFELPPLEGLQQAGRPVPGFSSAELAKGAVSIINVWASWCLPCRQEHPYLMQLEGKVSLYGINYKDNPAEARRFLGALGNPFTAVGVDGNGRVSIDWGVYGVPETYVVDGKGRITYRHVGPISAESLKDAILPAIEKARSAK